MIIRKGFISNSSSSSFILGYAIIKDEEKFKKYCKKNEIKFVEIDYKNNEKDKYEDVQFFDNLYLQKENRILRASNNTELIIPRKEVLIEDIYEFPFADYKILRVEIGNNEGDDKFYIEEEEELDYSIAEDINFYTGWQRALIELFQEKDIVDVEKSKIIYGAERNG